MTTKTSSNYSLTLTRQGKIIFKSRLRGLLPLLNLLNQFGDSEVRGCLLEDKVVGLAAAKIIVHARIISSVKTPLASKTAISYLEKHNVSITADQVVDSILNKGLSGICYMEDLANKNLNFDQFIAQLTAKLSSGHTAT